MAGVRVEITRFVDPAQPGFVECTLVDAYGQAWTFVDKVPVVTSEPLDEHSIYPRPAVIACTIVTRDHEDAGRDIVRIDTSQPWGIESTAGETRFDVLAEQVVE